MSAWTELILAAADEYGCDCHTAYEALMAGVTPGVYMDAQRELMRQAAAWSAEDAEWEDIEDECQP